MAIEVTTTTTDPSKIPTPEQMAGAEVYRDLAIDADGDMYLDGSGDLAGVFGADGVASDLQARLRTFLGEYTWNMSLGFPWRQEVLGERPTSLRLEELLRAESVKTPGVVGIDNFRSSRTGRTLSMSFDAQTDLGQVILVSLTSEPTGEG